MEINSERYTKSLLIVLAVYFILFLFTFLPFVGKAAEIGLLGDSFVWLITILNLVPLPLFALYFLGKIDGKIARLGLMAAAFAASFLSVFFVLPLQL